MRVDKYERRGKSWQDRNMCTTAVSHGSNTPGSIVFTQMQTHIRTYVYTHTVTHTRVLSRLLLKGATPPIVQIYPPIGVSEAAAPPIRMMACKADLYSIVITKQLYICCQKVV